ncbi:MAG: GatB/YqeY domain-containing protein [Rhodocyclaceae bacterium]
MSLKERVTDEMKDALRARETARLSALRLLLAAIRQREIDERIELDDAGVLAVIEKMLKQRKDSIRQYDAAGRKDLADIERGEIAVLNGFMPAAASEAEIEAAVAEAIASAGARSMADMGRVMTSLRARLAGRADMAQVSSRVRQRLGQG